jgi:hypothetical protein
MKKVLILLLMSCSGSILFASEAHKKLVQPIKEMALECLYEDKDPKGLSELMAKWRTAGEDPFPENFCTYIEEHNPQLFPARDEILRIVTGKKTINKFKNPESLTLGQQVAERFESFLGSYSEDVKKWNWMAAQKALRSYPIILDHYIFLGDTIREPRIHNDSSYTKTTWDDLCVFWYNNRKALWSQDHDRRLLKEMVFGYLAGIENLNTHFFHYLVYLREYKECLGLSEDSYVLDHLEKQGNKADKKVARELKKFLKEVEGGTVMRPIGWQFSQDIPNSGTNFSADIRIKSQRALQNYLPKIKDPFYRKMLTDASDKFGSYFAESGNSAHKDADGAKDPAHTGENNSSVGKKKAKDTAPNGLATDSAHKKSSKTVSKKGAKNAQADDEKPQEITQSFPWKAALAVSAIAVAGCVWYFNQDRSSESSKAQIA